MKKAAILQKQNCLLKITWTSLGLTLKQENYQQNIISCHHLNLSKNMFIIIFVIFYIHLILWVVSVLGYKKTAQVINTSTIYLMQTTMEYSKYAACMTCLMCPKIKALTFFVFLKFLTVSSLSSWMGNYTPWGPLSCTI